MSRTGNVLTSRASVWRAAIFQMIGDRPGMLTFRKIAPVQLARPVPRGPRGLSPTLADLARPIRCPQRQIGRRAISALPPIGTPAFGKMMFSLRRRRDVFVDHHDLRNDEFMQKVLLLAAAGAQVRLKQGVVVPSNVGARTVQALSAPAARSARSAELRSVRVRRSALRELWAEESQPKVSVLLASRRPADIASAIAQVRRQVDVQIELVVGLHGDDWESHLDEVTRGLPPGSVLRRFEAAMPLGTVLNELTSFATHDLVTKWDDDDWYGPDHVADLVSAYRYSGADVVGKAAEFVRLEASDETIRRFEFGAESYGTTIAGGTILTSIDWLGKVGGWSARSRGVDRALIDATVRNQGSVYRTHGYQYMLRRRHDVEHTWSAADQHFAMAAGKRVAGLDLGMADICANEVVEPTSADPVALGHGHGERNMTGSQWDLVSEVIPDDIAVQVSESYYVDRVVGSLGEGDFVLDVGCGEGKGRRAVAKANPGVRWVGVDVLSSPEVDLRRPTVRDVLTFDGVDLPLRSASIDCAMSLQVLEHVRYPEPLLQEIARVLKPGGSFFGTTSNLEPYHSYSFWNFTPYGLLTILSDAGLEVVELRPGIDGPTLIERQILGRPPEMSRFFGTTSPRNAEFLAWGERSRRRPALVNNRMLQFCGHISFLATRPDRVGDE